tara:strand:- start:6283 stop:7167 length:885 start_codon:yes stop_codon:yes gene_type:complete
VELKNYRRGVFKLTDTTPFVDSENYHDLLKKSGDFKYSQISTKLNEDGYCIVDLEIDNQLIDRVNVDIEKEIIKNSYKKNAEAFHYNESPRIVEGWKFSEAIKKIVLNKKLSDILTFCYKSNPIPISTINFVRGAEQPQHSDEFHFGSIPHRYLTGCWIALEDVTEKCGPLSIVKGSHKLPIFSFEQIGVKIPKTESEFKKAYTMYEDWVREEIDKHNLCLETPLLKKGQTLIWLSNTLHGSEKIKAPSTTRKSLVIHFHYERCEKIFFPTYSNLAKARYVPRNINSLDIRNTF